jgi:hypothetical protein
MLLIREGKVMVDPVHERRLLWVQQIGMMSSSALDIVPPRQARTGILRCGVLIFNRLATTLTR